MNQEDILVMVQDAICDAMRAGGQARKSGEISTEEGKELFRMLGNALSEVTK